MTKKHRFSLWLALAATLASSAPAGALVSLGPTELPVAIVWSTNARITFQDLAGGPAKETVSFVESRIVPLSLSITVVDWVTREPRVIVAEQIDPFWNTIFNFKPLQLDEAGIPAAPATTGDVPYIGQYGNDPIFATQYSTNTAFVSADVFPTTGEMPVMSASGTTALIDCCDVRDQQNIVYGPPDGSGLWLDTDGDMVADTNAAILLSKSILPLGNLDMTLQVVRPATCTILAAIRGECSATAATSIALFTVVLAELPPPTPECDLDGDGTFSRQDIRAFNIGCKTGTATWLCDTNGDGTFNLSDTLFFTVGCRGSLGSPADAVNEISEALGDDTARARPERR